MTCPFEPNGWTEQAGACSVSDSNPDVIGFVYGFDTPTPETFVDAEASTNSIAPDLPTGWHTLDVEAINSSGVYSGLTQIGFGMGVGGLSSPLDQQSTAGGVLLSGGAQPTETQLTYNYRIGTVGTWRPLRDVDVTITSSGAKPSWPLAISSGLVPDMTWDVAATVAADGGDDGPVQIQGCYNHKDPFTLQTVQDGCSSTTTVLLERSSFAGVRETEPLGPGQLAAATGDLLVGATDASIVHPFGTLSFGRTLTTLSPTAGATAATGVLGPGWRLSLPGPDYTGAPDLTPSSSVGAGYATLTDEVGATYTYKTTDTDYPYTFNGLGEAADGSVLTAPDSTTFTLTDADGTITTWTQNASFDWVLSKITEPGKHATTYMFDASGRLSEVAAPPASGITGCSAIPPTVPVSGCRLLDFAYADSTTATGYTSSGWGDYAGQLSAVTYTAYDPLTSGMKTVTVAKYAYDPSGLLRAEWDPRIIPALKTTYGYDSDNRLTTITQPGLNPWTITYDDTHRVASVSQTDPVNGVATEAVAYGVPTVTTDGAPVDLSAAATATWGENTDLPFGTGTAIFPPDHVPSLGSNGDYAPGSGDWPYATLYYRDVNGREVNTAQYGAGDWLVDSTRYDAQGNVVWELSPGNRAQALSPTSDTDPAVAAITDSAQRANALATTYVYTDDGTADGRDVDLTDVYSPKSPMVLNNGSTVDAQSHTHYSFDEGAPAGPPLHLVTTTTTAAYYKSGSGGPTDHDVRTTRLGYDPTSTADGSGWDLRSPTLQTVVFSSGTNLITKTRYNTDGNVIQTRMPKADAAGDDAYTTDTDYYSTGADSGHPECGNHPEWAGMVCWSGPAGQPAGQPMPTAEATYNHLGEPDVVTETSGTATRTTTTTYDGAGRQTSVAISDTTRGAAQVPAVSYGYDPSTGLPTTQSTSTQTITTGYDAIGRPISYAVPAASGTNMTTVGYDIDGRPISVDDGKDTTSYSYDGTDSLGHTEHRGLVTAEDTGMGSNPSTFAAAYDADGNMINESYPANVVASSRYDNNDTLTSLTYTAAGSTLAQFSQTSNAFGEVRAQSSPQSSQTFTYDAAGRLSKVADTADGTCLTRKYTLDLDSNRTKLSTYPAATDGTCTTTTTPTATTWSHDAADRITNSGYSYDPMGRTLSVRDADTSPNSGNVTLSYFANDMIRTENDGLTEETFSLDPASRLFSMDNSRTGVTTTKIYSSPGDAPAWLSNSDGTWSRNVTDIAGNLAVIQTGASAGSAALQIINPHGDVVATLTDPSTGAAAMTAYFEYTEYGAPRTSNATAPANYGWLGGNGRDAGDLGGFVLMGARVYDPYSGRFTSVDPIPGGSANNYDYCNQDPINAVDLGGARPLLDGQGHRSGRRHGARPAPHPTPHSGPGPRRGTPTLHPSPKPEPRPRPTARSCDRGCRDGGGPDERKIVGFLVSMGMGFAVVALCAPECEIGAGVTKAIGIGSLHAAVEGTVEVLWEGLFGRGGRPSYGGGYGPPNLITGRRGYPN